MTRIQNVQNEIGKSQKYTETLYLWIGNPAIQVKLPSCQRDQ